MIHRKTLIHAAQFVIVFAALSALMWAQWPAYPTRSVPKTSDGKPDLNGPVPRMPDGKPDFSGLWEAARLRGNGQRGTPSNAPLQPAPPPPPSTDGGPPLATFFNLGAGFKDGLPYTPWAAEVRKKREADNAKDNPDAHCLPIGLMQLHLHPQPRKIIHTADVVVILYEAQGEVRQIFTDGRLLPKNDPQPWWRGYSVGHWEGDTLVVETTGFRDDVWLDVNGSPLTNTGKMTERFRRVNYGNLQIDITIEDPKAYTKPFTVRVNQRVMLDTDLIEFVCNENEKSSHHYTDK
ncbi:MAG: hypothetical protein DMG14_16855 [Acidobacteria bacterium]|nr:MAG: hypothetical protein DMG14_16855 [Acidobacteriota bacterium]